MVVGTLKPSITFGLLGLLQLTPSLLPLLPSLQLTTACSPHSSSLPAHSPCSSSLPLLQLAPSLPPSPPEVVGTPIHTKLFIGHWKQAGSKGSKLEWAGARGASWEQAGVRGASWEWGEPVLAYQNWWAHWNLPRHVVGTPKCTPQYPLGPTCA